MHIVIINGSPRVKQYSNTDKIIQAFGEGLREEKATYELYSLSNRKEWDAAREAFMTHERIIMALPLYVECVSGLMLEFLASLPVERTRPAELAFILHSGFGEGHQLRLGEQFLQSLPAQLGCSYGGCLVRGDSFSIRLSTPEQARKIVKPYIAMGRSYAIHGNFLTKEAAKFTGPERYPWLLRKVIGALIDSRVSKHFERFAKEWGCTRPLNDQPYLKG